MRAAIDIGSNSIRLAMSDGSVRSEITQLALGIERTGKLDPDGIRKTLAVLSEYAKATASAESVIAFATEAVRRAADGDEFCASVKATTGLSVTVLSPAQEAYLALNGAVKPQGAVTVCDLGGGSMELISSADGITPNYVKSLPLGVVVLKNKFKGDFRKVIDAAPSLVAEFGDVPPYPLVLSGGSACAIAAAMLDLKAYDKTAVSTLFTARELDGHMPMLLDKKLPVFRPLCAKRADTVPYGAIILQALINHVGATEFYVSDAGNLDAVLNGCMPPDD